jgi:hypothetical protein
MDNQNMNLQRINKLQEHEVIQWFLHYQGLAY